MASKFTDRPAGVYRLYGFKGDLLYIGCSVDPTQRFRVHRSATPWFYQVDERRTEVEMFDTHNEALAVEREAIRTESPVHNFVHNIPLCAVDGCEENRPTTRPDDAYCNLHQRRFDRWGDPLGGPPEGLSSTEMLALVPSMTYRQLDYWCTCGYIKPTVLDVVGSGNRRVFSPDDVDVLRTMSLLGQWTRDGSLFGRIVAGEVAISVAEALAAA